MSLDRSDQNTEARPVVFAAVLGLTVVLKLLPYLMAAAGFSLERFPWNFSPIVPVCLFGAVFVRSPRLAIAAPLAGWLIGDLAIGVITRDLGSMIYPEQPFTYLAIAVCVALGFVLRRHVSVTSTIAVGLATAVLFFLVTNVGVWLASGIYPWTAEGLMACLVAGLPFFRYTLLSQVVFLPVLFSPLAVRQVPAAMYREGVPA